MFDRTVSLNSFCEILLLSFIQVGKKNYGSGRTDWHCYFVDKRLNTVRLLDVYLVICQGKGGTNAISIGIPVLFDIMLFDSLLCYL